MSDVAPILRAEGLHKYLGQGDLMVHALKGVSLALAPSTAYAIVGPSGCGKSTLLYLLGLLDRQDRGEIWIRGHQMSQASDVARTAARCEHLGFVFQFHFLLPEFTALENVILPMRRRGRWTAKEMEERATGLLAAVGLGEKRHRLATQLSGGEQQRVAIARALSNEPAIILADEPTGNLDTRTSDAVFQLLLNLCHDQGPTILMVTHNPELAERADQRLEMRDGQFVDAL